MLLRRSIRCPTTSSMSDSPALRPPPPGNPFARGAVSSGPAGATRGRCNLSNPFYATRSPAALMPWPNRGQTAAKGRTPATHNWEYDPTAMAPQREDAETLKRVREAPAVAVPRIEQLVLGG